jgi:NDP-sugar pyrophosphorylase family protein
MIPALVLTAGLATRLRPLSRVRAKAALPVAGQPLVHRIIRWLAAAGVRDFVLNLHHLPHTITGVVGDGSELGVRVRYSWEMPVLGSAGGPRHALPLLDSSSFVIANGDTLTDVDVAAVEKDHRRHGALVTLALVPNTEPEKYGGVLVDESGTVTGFTRKGAPVRSYHFIGLQIAEAEVFAGLADNTPYESVARLYPDLMQAKPASVRGYVCDAEFLDIGTPADYLATYTRIATREGHPLPADENVKDTVLWDDVVIERGAKLERCVITDGVRVPETAEWRDVAVRVANGELEPFERLDDGLALSPLIR